MRVISGLKKGQILQSPKGDEIVRPTTDRVKEALFSILNFDLENAAVLDLFAGSGQLGIESLSRGARKAIFVDSNAQSVALTNKNLLACGFENLATVKLADFKVFLTTNNEKFDIIFLDPPYHLNLWGTALNLIECSIAPRGIIALEHPIECPIEDLDGYFRKDYKYGKIIVTIFRKEA